VAIGEKELNLATELPNGVYTVVVKGSSFDMKQRMVISH
jgi:hypothetical protein